MKALHILLLSALMAGALMAPQAHAATDTEQQLREVLRLSAMDGFSRQAVEAMIADPEMFKGVEPAKRECLVAPISAVLNDAMVKDMLKRLDGREKELLPRWLAFYRGPGGEGMAARQRLEMYGEPLPKHIQAEPSDQEREQVAEFVGSGAFDAFMGMFGGMEESMPAEFPEQAQARVQAECGVTIDAEEFS